jgi:hypothetical protein
MTEFDPFGMCRILNDENLDRLGRALTRMNAMIRIAG